MFSDRLPQWDEPFDRKADSLVAAMTVAFAGPDVPEVVMIGAEVGQIYPFTDRLSPALEAALDPAVDLIVRECANRHEP